MTQDNGFVLFESGEPCMLSLPRDARLPILPLAAGWQREHGSQRHINWDNSTRTTHGAPERSVLLFQYTMSGSAVFRDEDGERILKPGTGFLVPFGSPTSYWLPRDMEWEWIWVSVQSRELYRWGEALVAEQGYCFELPPDTGAVPQLAGLLADRFAGKPLDAEEVSARAYRFFMEIPRTLRAGGKPGGVAERALALIETCFCDPSFNVSELARRLGVSRAHFTRLFAAENGEPPGKTIETRRLQNARELAALSELSVKEICFSSGYRNVSHFCAQFKKRFGCTPGGLL
ncbi:AraC family transcriptional regulator [Tichowtungia aerotolerans]|uniref:Helix-turn-helix domain-containing protein n=1 Tax=Tichowtungia aerotolerans TaxID=2697043 RepID=A0A6P1M375_9BACT|nr:AraC family transcriptional regulator [Tichowtungia aerotolerans]QHI68552.1 helix-turn-helix domain-containing protein [Tichowtungia aerotolerans]